MERGRFSCVPVMALRGATWSPPPPAKTVPVELLRRVLTSTPDDSVDNRVYRGENTSFSVFQLKFGQVQNKLARLPLGAMYAGWLDVALVRSTSYGTPCLIVSCHISHWVFSLNSFFHHVTKTGFLV